MEEGSGCEVFGGRTAGAGEGVRGGDGRDSTPEAVRGSTGSTERIASVDRGDGRLARAAESTVGAGVRGLEPVGDGEAERLREGGGDGGGVIRPTAGRRAVAKRDCAADTDIVSTATILVRGRGE